MNQPNLRKSADGYWRCAWVDACGERHYKAFGRDKAQARNRFQAWLQAWRTDPTVRTPSAEGPLTIERAWLRYRAHAIEYYRLADGTPTRTVENITHAIRPVLELFGTRLASEMTPKMLDATRERMIDSGICISIINQRVNMIRRVWKWLARQELVPASTWHSLLSLEALRPGRSRARVSSPVKPVADEWVDSTCAALPPSIAAMVRIQQLTGMRPGEVCSMRPADIDTNGQVWLYCPAHHKTAHHGHTRRILIGPRAQAVLLGYLGCELTEPVFRPALAMAERNRLRREAFVPAPGVADYRTTPSYQRRLADYAPTRYRYRWTTSAYALAVRRAAAEAGVPHWSPNQLRHSAATRLRKSAGLEVAQVVLGHKHAAVTEIYAEADTKLASQAMLKLG